MARGGKREGSGRPKGAYNKATVDIREAAQQYTQEALETLLSVMREGDTSSARAAAANSVLDRGHGKPTQVMDTTVRLADVSDEPVVSEEAWARDHGHA
jgi:predicted ArsR family transcriptional regulator